MRNLLYSCLLGMVALSPNIYAGEPQDNLVSRVSAIQNNTVDEKGYSRTMGGGSNEISFHYGSKSISKMSDAQVKTVDTYLNFLQNPRVRADLCLQIREDLADKQSEHGGIIVNNPKNPFIGIRADQTRTMQFKDRLGLTVTVMSPSSNSHYRLPSEIRKLERIGEYHLHAVHENGSSRGPSGAISGHTDCGYSGDLGHAIHQINETGSSNQLVITKTKIKDWKRGPSSNIVTITNPPKMNVHYYGGEKSDDKNGDKSDRVSLFVLNLGDYEYRLP